MASEAQVVANRRNAEKSTGPRTAEGKAAVGQNAVKHGLSGQADVIKGEDQAEFERHREALHAELRPVGAVESMLVERVVSLSWRLKRVERMQNEVFDALLADGATPLARLARSLVPGGTGDDEDLALGRAVVKDFSNSRVLDRLLMYERRMEHSLLKTLNDLHLRRLRVREYVSRHMDEIGTEPTDYSNAPSFPHSSYPRAGTRPSYVETPEHSNTPSLEYSTDAPDERAAEEPSRKTKPICPDLQESQLLCGTEIMDSLQEDGHEETKPIISVETGCPSLVGTGVGD